MLACSSTFLQTINLLAMYQLLWSFINLYKDNGCLVFLPAWLFKKASIIDYAILVSIYLCCKFCPMFGWRKIDRHRCFHCFYYCKAFFTWCVFLLKVSRLEKKKKASTSPNVFQRWNGNVTWYEGSVFLGCKGNNKKRFSSRGKEWNLCKDRLVTLSKIAASYIRIRGKSVY